jgi:hypothetical protein
MPRCLLLLILLASCAAPAEDWRPLFNGRDLSGWCAVNCAPSTFSVRDGMLHCDGHPTGVLRTDRMYGNFVLELDWRHLTKGGNSGLFVWSDPLPALGEPFTRAFEVQVMDGTETPDYTSDGDVFSIWGSHFVPDRPHPKGWERCLPSERRSHPSPEWNHYRVTCQDGVLSLAVNGAVVSGGHDATPRLGYLCLESEGSDIDFRNLRILELPGASPRPSDVASRADDSRSLFDGLDLAGWHAPDGSAPDPAHWQVRDGEIWTDGAGGSLVPDGMPDGLLFRFDWRREGAPSPRVPLVLWGDGASDPGVARDGWHRGHVQQHGRRSRVAVDGLRAAGGLAQERVAGEAVPAPLALQPDGQPTRFTNLFVRPLP